VKGAWGASHPLENGFGYSCFFLAYFAILGIIYSQLANI